MLFYLLSHLFIKLRRMTWKAVLLKRIRILMFMVSDSLNLTNFYSYSYNNKYGRWLCQYCIVSMVYIPFDLRNHVKCQRILYLFYIYPNRVMFLWWWFLFKFKCVQEGFSKILIPKNGNFFISTIQSIILANGKVESTRILHLFLHCIVSMVYILFDLGNRVKSNRILYRFPDSFFFRFLFFNDV